MHQSLPQILHPMLPKPANSESNSRRSSEVHGLHPLCRVMLMGTDARDQKRKILLVDEDANFRKVLRYFLTEMGFEVEEASNGRAALGRCRSEDYALMVAASNTPIMGKLNFLTNIIECRPMLPIVVVSAFSRETNKALAHSSTFVQFLEKPCDPAVFKEAIGGAINRSAEQSFSRSAQV